jgi:outer membrane protein
MKISNRLILSLLFLSLNTILFSQSSWSLEKCIEYAYENNIDIKKQQLFVKSAEKDLLQSKANFLPDLNGFLTHSYNYGQTIDPYTNEFATDRVQSNNFNIQSNWVLFNGFQILNSYKQSKLGLEAAKYDVDKLMDDISLSIANAYLAILYAEELLAVAQSQLDVEVVTTLFTLLVELR